MLRRPGPAVCGAQDAVMRILARIVENVSQDKGVIIPETVELIMNIPHT